MWGVILWMFPPHSSANLCVCVGEGKECISVQELHHSTDTVHYLPTHVQVLEVVCSNYDTLTLKLHDSLDHSEKYTEKPMETTFFTHLVSGVCGYIQCQDGQWGCGCIQCQNGQWGVWLYTVPEWSVGGVAIYSARMPGLYNDYEL